MKEEGCEWGRGNGKSKGKRRMTVLGFSARRRTASGEVLEPRKQHKERREQKEEARRSSTKH
jgi:hypothetical protein